jgi:hypothetical protein
MPSRGSRDIERALLAKGFRHQMSDHRRLILYSGDRMTSVRTKISHSAKDYGDDLLGAIQKQLRLQGEKRKFQDLLECPMSGEDYLAYLTKKGEVVL